MKSREKEKKGLKGYRLKQTAEPVGLSDTSPTALLTFDVYANVRAFFFMWNTVCVRTQEICWSIYVLCYCS